MLELDQAGNPELAEKLSFGKYTGGSNGAFTLLSDLASSMTAVAATVFSVTLVALALASQQVGSRVLLNFMQDMKYQVVLGTFLATFIYCLLVLRSIRVDGAN